MRTTFALLAIATALCASGSSSVAGATTACGAQDVVFDVQEDASPHPVVPEAGKALVYVIQEDGKRTCVGWGCLTIKVALMVHGWVRTATMPIFHSPLVQASVISASPHNRSPRPILDSSVSLTSRPRKVRFTISASELLAANSRHLTRSFSISNPSTAIKGSS